MKIRGERECKECGNRWSYYATGSVACPRCGSLHSVGVDEERRRHTAGPVAFSLAEARDLVDSAPDHDVASVAKDRCREYIRRRGFIDGGELQSLDETYLAAGELLHAADLVDRSFSPDDDEEIYFLSLLGGADGGERPPPDDVPESMREARGLAAANAVREYRREIRTWLDDRDVALDRETASLLGALDEHAKRVRSLQGDVPPETADRLVAAARDVAAGLVDDDEPALARARDRIDRLSGR